MWKCICFINKKLFFNISLKIILNFFIYGESWFVILYLCESINVRRFFLGLRVVDSLFVFYYLLVCEIEDELVYNGNFI